MGVLGTEKPWSFGIHGGHVNCTDSRYVYMRAPVRSDNTPLYNYTLMPTHMRELFSIEELQTVKLADPFAFTKGCRTMRIESKGRSGTDMHRFGTVLFDLQKDPKQKQPITDPHVEDMMIKHMARLMKDNNAPVEQFERLGLPF